MHWLLGGLVDDRALMTALDNLRRCEFLGGGVNRGRRLQLGPCSSTVKMLNPVVS